MSKEEAIEQLNNLIEHFKNGGRGIDEKDMDSIKFLLEENKKLRQRDTYTNIVHNQFQIEKKEKRYYENTLDELEKWLEEENKKTFIDIVSISAYEKVLNKIKGLKGENNED